LYDERSLSHPYKAFFDTSAEGIFPKYHLVDRPVLKLHVLHFNAPPDMGTCPQLLFIEKMIFFKK
jgi:hypothetical protein